MSSKNATGPQVDQNREDEDGQLAHQATPTAVGHEADTLDEFCDRHQKKLIDHVYYEMLACTYGLSDLEAKATAKGVAARLEKMI